MIRQQTSLKGMKERGSGSHFSGVTSSSAVHASESLPYDTANAGVSHDAIRVAVQAVRDAAPGYDWNCAPGRWLAYTLLLALPFPAKAVRPDGEHPVWFCKPKRRVKGVVRERDLTAIPTEMPELPDAQFLLRECVGRIYDAVVLSGDALRPLADAWCRYAQRNLFRAAAVVRPLRLAAETARAAARAAGTLEDSEAEDRSTTSLRASTDSDAGSGSTADSDSEP